MAKLSTQQLQQAVKIRKRIDRIDIQRGKLEASLKRLLSGSAPKKRPSRPTKKKARAKHKSSRKTIRKRRAPKTNRKELVRSILKSSSKPLSIPEILKRLEARGFKTASKNPKKTLGVMLYTDKGIKKAGRGLFTTK